MNGDSLDLFFYQLDFIQQNNLKQTLQGENFDDDTE